MSLKAKSTISTLAAAATAICVSSANEVRTVSKIIACNTDTVARLISVYHDPTGGDGGVTATLVLDNYPLQAGETKPLPLSSLYLANGGQLLAVADVAGKVNASVNYTSAEQAP